MCIREQISGRDQPKVVDSPDNFFFQQREHLALSNMKKNVFFPYLWVFLTILDLDSLVLKTNIFRFRSPEFGSMAGAKEVSMNLETFTEQRFAEGTGHTSSHMLDLS